MSPKKLKDHLDDTIESVIRQQCHPDRLVKPRGSSRPYRSGGGDSAAKNLLPANSSCAITVREQLALKRAQQSADDRTLEGANNEGDSLPLDLSTKHSAPPPCVKSEVSPSVPFDNSISSDLSNGAGTSSSERSADSPSYPKKRTVAEEHLIRIPLELGWRRQTCIRSITSNGVRGDVIYYAPCGKRLGSYAEVIRYLAKNEMSNLNRKHFSFSCKVLAGEFLQIKPEMSKNGIVKLDENEVMKIIQNMTGETTANPHRRTSAHQRSFANTRSRRNRLPLSARRQYLATENASQQRQLLKAMESKRVEKEKECQARAQRILDAMRRAKEQELKKQHLAMWQKQAKQEKEKVRQQALAAKALEVRKRQEEKQRLVAERLIRQEEKIAARNAQQLRIKQMRQPVDDLQLDELKVLPEIKKVPGLKLCGQAFADVLMVMEFLNNFGQVLRIDMKDVPSLKDVHAGLLNSTNHMKYVRKLTKILLTLVLEYPGLPAGPQGKTFVGQLVRELKITYDNMSELLRMFLNSRDKEGQKLGSLLKDKTFESLAAAEKAAILAYMCNELLYCRNVVREIEGNIEETIRLKGEKWIREGKIRLLRGMQAKKRIERQKKGQSVSDSRSDDVSDEVGYGAAGEDFVGRAGTPNSISASESDAEMKSLAEMKNEALLQKREQGERKQFNSEIDNHMCKAGTPIKKPQPPGSHQSEAAITEEEKNMNVEELESRIDCLSKEADDLRERIDETACKVRAQPYGEDRFHRLYWVLPNAGGLLLESVESGHFNNPTCHLSSGSSVDCDVKDCLLDIINRLCDKEQKEAALDLTVLKGWPKEIVDTETSSSTCSVDGCGGRAIPLHLQTGWWLVQSKEELEQVSNSLQMRGIRERLLQRTLARYSDYVTRKFDTKEALLTTEEELETLGCGEVEHLSLKRLLNALKLLEEKVFLANIHIRQWKPPEYGGVDAVSSGESGTEAVHDVEDEESSKSSSLSSETSSSAHEMLQLATVKERLLKLEQNVERRYLLSPFHFCRSLLPESILNRASNPASPSVDKDNSLTADSHEEANSNSNLSDVGKRRGVEDDEVPAQLTRWRTGVDNATNPAQLMLCLLQLDANVAWEKSIMRASCQICHSGDNESKLLLCDGCDMGYHIYCFKPEMDGVPSGDWFCPSCISNATDKPCCLVCCKQDGNFINCAECGHFFHAQCLNLPSWQAELQPKQSPVSLCIVQKKLSRSVSSSSVSSSCGTFWKCFACSKPQHTVSALCTGITERETAVPSSSVENSLVDGGDLARDKQSAGRKKSWGSVRKKKAGKIAKDSKEATPVGDDVLSVEELCSVMLAELDAHKDSWPFKLPVDVKVFPLYKKVIKKPMDLSCIKSKLNSHKYESEEEFSEDVSLIFRNCKTFNEDDSPVGKAGHSLKRYFCKRWKELKEGNQRKN